MNLKWDFKRIASLLMLFVLLAACAPAPVPVPTALPDGTPYPTAVPTETNSLNIMADYQISQTFGDTGIIDACRSQTKVNVSIDYKTSTSVRMENETPSGIYDAYWSTSLGFLPNTPVSPIYTAKTYIVIGSTPTVANKLQWDPNYLKLKDVLKGIPTGDVKLFMTEPSQSDPSASFFLAAASVFANQSMLTQDGLDRLPVDQIRSYFGNLKGTTDSVTEFKKQVLKDLMEGTGKYNTYVLYEATLIQINQELVKAGKSPIHAYYLADATMGAKFPIALRKGSNASGAFTRFVNCVKSVEMAPRLQKAGYRTEEFGYSMDNADPAVFNQDWGVSATMKDLPLVDYPRAEVTAATLTMYRTAFKPKVNLCFVLDTSGSMYDQNQIGWKPLTKATDMIFDQKQANAQFLSIGPEDTYCVILFDHNVYYLGAVSGKDTASVTKMAETIKSQNHTTGKTALYDALYAAIGILTNDDKNPYYDKAFPVYDTDHVCAIYTMTDGITNMGRSLGQFETYYDARTKASKDYPAHPCKIFGVGFGTVDMDKGDFVDVVAYGHGIMKDGRKDLTENVKGMFSNLIK